MKNAFNDIKFLLRHISYNLNNICMYIVALNISLTIYCILAGINFYPFIVCLVVFFTLYILILIFSIYKKSTFASQKIVFFLLGIFSASPYILFKNYNITHKKSYDLVEQILQVVTEKRLYSNSMNDGNFTSELKDIVIFHTKDMNSTQLIQYLKSNGFISGFLDNKNKIIGVFRSEDKIHKACRHIELYFDANKTLKINTVIYYNCNK